MGITISAIDLTKKFKETVAVQNLNFSVKEGELFAFLGPPGAGKTTTLNLLAGILLPDEGDIKVGGKSILELKPQERDFAMVFESYALYPHLTVEQNIAFPLMSPMRSNQYSKGEIKEKVLNTAKMLGIDELLTRYPKELSGGQKQRVGVGRALIRDTELYLLDEPIAHLDAKLRHHMRGELKRLQKKSGRTTILATPDYNEVVAMADRAAILNNGEIQQIGTPLDLFNRPKNIITAASIGDPPINLFDFKLKTKDAKTNLVGDGFSIVVNEKLSYSLKRNSNDDSFVLGVRPGKIEVENDKNRALLSGEVYIFEPLGAQGILTVKIGEKLVKLRTDTNDRYEIGKNVYLSFKLNDSTVFHKETGEAILM